MSRRRPIETGPAEVLEDRILLASAMREQSPPEPPEPQIDAMSHGTYIPDITPGRDVVISHGQVFIEGRLVSEKTEIVISAKDTAQTGEIIVLEYFPQNIGGPEQLTLYGVPISVPETSDLTVQLPKDANNRFWMTTNIQEALLRPLSDVSSGVSSSVSLTVKGGDKDDDIELIRIGDVIPDFSGSVKVVIEGGPGDDTLEADRTDHPVTLLGGLGDDTLIGGGGDDLINGGGGSDALNGNDGDDTLVDFDTDGPGTRGVGSDTLSGGNGNDKIFSGGLLEFERATDIVFGEAGNDDIFIQGPGIKEVSGGAGNDDIRIRGNLGIAIVDGGLGNDLIRSERTIVAPDELDGGVGDDILLVDAFALEHQLPNFHQNIENIFVALDSL